MPLRRLLVGIRGAEHLLLLERPADDLQADGQLPAAQAARKRDGRHPRQVHRNRVDVRQVHLQGVLDLLAQLESRRRHRGRDDHVHLLEDLVEVPLDQRPHGLRLPVVRVVVASRQRVGPQHDAPLHLRPEALLPGLHVHLQQALLLRRAVPILDAIVPGEVRGCLRRGDQVVRRDGVLRHRERDLLDLGLERLHLDDRRPHRELYLRVEALGKELQRHADLHPAQVLLQRLRVVGHWQVGRRGIQRIMAGDHLHHHGRVPHVLRDRPDLIERRGEGHQAVARHPAVGRFEAHHAAAGGGLPDRAARVRAQRRHAQLGGHGRGRAPAGPAGDIGQVPGVPRRPEG